MAKPVTRTSDGRIARKGKKKTPAAKKKKPMVVSMEEYTEPPQVRRMIDAGMFVYDSLRDPHAEDANPRHMLLAIYTFMKMYDKR